MFGKRLKLVAVKYYGTMKELARVSNINYEQLSGYVNGRRSPGLDVLEILANIGINVDWLITGEGEMMKNIDYDMELMTEIENYQQLTVELNNKLDLFLRNKYLGSAAAGRLLPKKDDGE